MDLDVECDCLEILGHLDAIKISYYKRIYKPSCGSLAYEDWTTHPYIWLTHVQSSDGEFIKDPALESEDSNFYDLKDVQRYFISENHCESILFTSQYPNLKFPTSHGNHLWNLKTARILHNKLYYKDLNNSLETSLKKYMLHKHQINRLIISDRLFNINRFDYYRRKTFFRFLNKILSYQRKLELVSLENLQAKRLEGVRFIQQLACFCAHTLKYLFLWRFLRTDENPLLINYSYITGSGLYYPRPDSRKCFLSCLSQLRNLRLLSIEYAHIADESGRGILDLIPILKRPNFKLHILCREEHIPTRANPALGAAGYGIPDNSWRQVKDTCPDIYLVMVFFCVRDYDNILRFLSPSVPLREFHTQYGIDLLKKQRQHSDTSCLIRHLACNYEHILVSLHLHQWRFVSFPLCQILKFLPRLTILSYIGILDNEKNLRDLLIFVSIGVCSKLKLLNIQVQDKHLEDEKWAKVCSRLNEEFRDIFLLLETQLCLHVYKH